MYRICQTAISHHHHLVKKVFFFHAKLGYRILQIHPTFQNFTRKKCLEQTAGLNISPYQVPPHIPEYCPFLLQPKQFHVIHYALSTSLPFPAHTFPPPPPYICKTTPNHPHSYAQDVQTISIYQGWLLPG